VGVPITSRLRQHPTKGWTRTEEGWCRYLFARGVGFTLLIEQKAGWNHTHAPFVWRVVASIGGAELAHGQEQTLAAAKTAAWATLQ
jgi:hypothetical protein